MQQTFVYDAVRTPRGRGKPGGALYEVTAVSLAAQMLRALRERSGLPADAIDDVVMGCGAPVGEQGGDIGRAAVLAANYAETTSGMHVDRFCGSGLEACSVAAAKVRSGEARLAIGGGVESMSRIGLGAAGGAWKSDPTLTLNTHYVPQGVAADALATKYGFSRKDVDQFAVTSQRRAARAWAEGRFERAIVPVVDALGLKVLDRDEHLRPDTSLETLALMKPAFAVMGASDPGYDAVIQQRYPELDRIDHVHHAGNSSGIVDGAAAVLIGDFDAGRAFGITPRARIAGYVAVGSEPSMMLTGPEFATQKLLNRLGMTAADVDLWEINEAFASVALRWIQALDLDPDAVNVNGGAIAMGHPIGATGAMLLGAVVDELERTDKHTGLISLCVAGGMGVAAVVERI
jgi:acetyl-CoA C-acetyltransferase